MLEYSSYTIWGMARTLWSEPREGVELMKGEEQQEPKAGSLTPAVRYARLYRRAHELGLDKGVQEQIQQYIWNQLALPGDDRDSLVQGATAGSSNAGSSASSPLSPEGKDDASENFAGSSLDSREGDSGAFAANPHSFDAGSFDGDSVDSGSIDSSSVDSGSIDSGSIGSSDRDSEAIGADPLDASSPSNSNAAANDAIGSKQEAAADELWQHSGHHCELKLRQLIQGGSTWQVLAPFAWHWYRLRPEPKTAAHLVEFSYLYGDSAAAIAVIEDLGKKAPYFYCKVHAAIRVQLLLSQWRLGQSEKLLNFLIEEREGAWLDPVERLCLFLTFNRGAETTLPYLYFKHFEKELVAGVKQAGTHLRVGLPTLYFWVARLAVNLGFIKEATAYIKHIDPRDKEYDDALKLLQGLGSHAELISTSDWGEQLTKLPDAGERLRLLRLYLERVAGKKELIDLNAIALNAILDDPLRLLPSEPELWSQLCDLLLRHYRLLGELPNLCNVFLRNALSLYEPALDGAIWQNFLADSEATSGPLFPYFKGVALLHCFILKAGDEREEVLWQAQRLILGYEQEHQGGLRPPYHPWQNLQRWAMAMVEAAPFIPALKKKIMLAQLRMASPPANRSLKDMEDYLSLCPRPPLLALAELQEFARSREAFDFELQLLLGSGRRGHLTTADLQRVWFLAARRGYQDLAWRSASVLLCRGSLQVGLQKTWEISGENRKNYSWHNLQASDLDCCLLDFAPEESRLVWACIKLQTLLPQLLSDQDKNITVGRGREGGGERALAAKADSHLSTLKWFGPLKKDYRVGDQGLLPAFAEILPANEWSMLAAVIAHRMGMAAWKWRLSRLSDAVNQLHPKGKQNWQMFQRDQSHAAKWLRGLSSEQRSAWHDLVSICQKIGDERGFRVLASFVCRLATIIYPHHKQALASLQEMRAPVFLIWDLETWLLSEPYSRMRRLRGLEHKVPVPPSHGGE